MKKWPLVSLAVAVAILIVVAWYADWARLQQVSFLLQSEAGAYHDEVAKRAAGVAITLAKPYLDDETRGKFLGRLETLNRKEGVLIIGLPADTYGKIISDIAAAIESWSHTELERRGGGGSEERIVLLQATARPTIVELRQLLEDVVMISLRDFERPKDVEVARQELSGIRQRLGCLLGEHEPKH